MVNGSRGVSFEERSNGATNLNQDTPGVDGDRYSGRLGSGGGGAFFFLASPRDLR